MHGFDDVGKPDPKAEAGATGPWYKELNSYHWYVLIVAALGWLFDTMDQQLFVLARQPALADLLDLKPSHPDVLRYSGYATSIFIIGWASGGLLFGFLGDKLGRARTMVMTILIYSIFTGLSALSITWWDFAIYRFITGMGVGGEFAAGVALVAEVMPARARPYALGLLQALSAVGNMMAAGIFLLISSNVQGAEVHAEGGEIGLSIQNMPAWRWVFLVGILPALLAVVIRRRLKEPESWVKARAQALERDRTRKPGDPDDGYKGMGDISEMFTDARWRYHTIIGVILATAGVMGLWGVGFWTAELVRSFIPAEEQAFYVSMTSLLQNAGAFFGIYGFGLIAGKMGRKPAFAISFVLALAATVMVFGFMQERSQIWWMIPMLGFSGLMIFGGFAIYFPELYPTRLRSTGVGFCYNVARYLAAAAPFVLGSVAGMFAAPEGSDRAAAKLSEFTILSSFGGVDSPFRYAAITLSSVFVIGLVVIPFAPETKGKPLPE